MGWQPIETCPENTWVLVYAPASNKPYIHSCCFKWVENEQWDNVDKETKKKRIYRERQWMGGSWGGDYWMPLPSPP